MGKKTQLSGFSRGDADPTKGCRHCIWMGTGYCNQPVVLDDPAVPKDRDGKVEVNPKDRCDYFQNRKDVLFWVVRHGATGANAEDVFRGWAAVPLNAQGKKQAKDAAAFLEDKDIKKIHTSDLRRAKETAEIISQEIGAPVKEDPRLRAWDVGAFAGKSRKTHQKAFDKYVEKPNREIPMGESMKEFSARASDATAEYARKEDAPLVVTSSSFCLQLEKFVENKDPFGKPEQAIPPGGVMAVLDEKGKISVEEVFGEVIRPASYGS
jgi:broad specificity phosphatase PhoE